MLVFYFAGYIKCTNEMIHFFKFEGFPYKARGIVSTKRLSINNNNGGEYLNIRHLIIYLLLTICCKKYDILIILGCIMKEYWPQHIDIHTPEKLMIFIRINVSYP